jgi:lipoprotein-anchoring transpeptidase ErfK/SrfK
MRIRMGNGSAGRRRWQTALAAVAAATVLLSAGCSGKDSSSPSWQEGGNAGREADGAAASPQPRLKTVAVTSPAADASGVKALTEIKYTSEDPENTTVEVKDADGKEVTGTLDKDDKVFRPSKALAWGEKYTVTVNGTPTADKDGTTTSAFTVMKKPSKLVRITSHLGDGAKVGVGMPLIIKFSRSVPTKYRAAVERRMTVDTTPKQEGAWNWISGTEMHYRAKDFWKANTKISYDVKLQGVEMGDGYYGRSDIGVDLSISRSFVMTVDAKAKKMVVKQNGKTIKTIPVSLGKASTPSSSGIGIVMEKKRHTVFDTMDELPEGEGYRTEIDYAQRYTWGGEFIHAAPWSEGVQGVTNVSHGCVNVSEAMGKWLFDRTIIGDPIEVRGTPRDRNWQNGWNDYDKSWSQWKKGSAL